MKSRNFFTAASVAVAALLLSAVSFGATKDQVLCGYVPLSPVTLCL